LPLKKHIEINAILMACLEVSRGRRVEGKKVVGRRVKENGYPLLYLDVFKISKGKGSNQSFLLFRCLKN